VLRMKDLKTKLLWSTLCPDVDSWTRIGILFDWIEEKDQRNKPKSMFAPQKAVDDLLSLPSYALLSLLLCSEFFSLIRLNRFIKKSSRFYNYLFLYF
jgi:hypothetical protein